MTIAVSFIHVLNLICIEKDKSSFRLARAFASLTKKGQITAQTKLWVRPCFVVDPGDSLLGFARTPSMSPIFKKYDMKMT